VTQKIHILGLGLAPWRFSVLAICGFVFALTAGRAWLPMAKVGSNPLDMLLSAQVASFVLLNGATSFLYVGVLSGWPAWRREAFFFNLVVLAGYTCTQLLPLLLG